MKEMLQLAIKNIKSQRKSTIIRVGVIVLSMIALIGTSVFSKIVKEEFNSIRNIPTFHIGGTQFVGEDAKKQAEEFYEKMKNDDRLIEIGEGDSIGLSCGILNAEEIFGEGVSINFSMCQYYDYYMQFATIERPLEKGEVLIPKYIPCGEMTYEYFSDDEYIETSEFIGETIEVGPRLYGKKMELKVVGQIDNVVTGEYGEEIYVSKETRDEYKEFIGESSVDGDETVINYYAIAKDVEDMDELEKEGINPKGILLEDFGEWEAFVDVVNSIGKLVFALSMLNLVILIVKNVKKRKNEFAVMKAMGYNQTMMYQMLGMEVGIIFVLGIMIGLVVTQIGMIVLNILKYNVLSIIYAERYVFAMDLVSVFICIGMLALCLVVTYGLAADRIGKINISKELKA